MNNYARLALFVSLPFLVAGCADLVVTSVSEGPFTGPLLQMKATVKNEGWADAPASTTKVEVKTPTSASFTQVATTATPALPRGQQINLPVWHFHPSQFVPQGQCFDARVCADSSNAVFEGWVGDSNNCRTKSICNGP